MMARDRIYNPSRVTDEPGKLIYFYVFFHRAHALPDPPATFLPKNGIFPLFPAFPRLAAAPSAPQPFYLLILYF